MNKYQGEDIDFNLAIDTTSPESVESWSDFDSVVLYFYTHTSRISKFKTPSATGYGELTISDDGKTLSGTITGEQSKLMEGTMYMDILVTKADSKRSINKIITGTYILPDAIKSEL